VKTPVHRIILNATLTDDSGNINAVFYGRQAETILGMSAEKAWELVSQTGDDKAPIKTVSKDILGKEIIVAGRATYDPFTGGLQLTARELRIPVEGNRK
jgi:replication factor A1